MVNACRRRAPRAQTSDSLLPAFVAAAVVLTVLVPLQPLISPGRLGTAMAGITAVLAAGFWGACLACLHPAVRAFLATHAHEVGLVACLFASLGQLSELVLLGRPDTAGPLMVFLLAAGALTNRRRYSAAITVACLVEWFAVAAAHGFSGDWAPLSALVLCAAVLAALLNGIRCRAADGLVRARAEVLASALTDDLTGLANRRGLLAAAADLPAASPVAPRGALFLDLDGLKHTNDRDGHAAGDRLVLAAADALLRAVRPGDVVARLGGDEFAVLLTDTSPEQAQKALDRVRDVLAQAGVPASIGLALGTTADRIDDLLQAADAAMYAVKQQRRGATPEAAGPTGPATARAAGEPARPTPKDASAGEPGAVGSPADLRDLSRTCAWLHLAVVPVHLLLLPQPDAAPMAAVNLAVALAFGLVHVLATLGWTRRSVAAHATGFLTGGLVLLCAETLLYVAVVGQPWTSLAVVLAVVGTAGVLTSRTSATVVSLATAAGWVGLAVAHQPEQGWTRHGVTLLSALCIAALLNVTHRRTVARLTAAQQAVRAVALTDDLTGLSNRRGFLSAARPALDEAARRGSPLSVLYLDLDGLKLVNDRRGHAAGDDLLATAADVLRQGVEPGDVCARFGGDEFTVLLQGCPPAEVPARVRSIEEALAARSVSASIGVAHLSAEVPSLEALLDRADTGMFAVKRERTSRRTVTEASLT